jgi:hypothetical protein
MSQETDNLLIRGLKGGFAGDTTVQTVNRSGFDLKSSHLENSDGVYHDEWCADRAGGGQEIVKVGNDMYTRVYAGGTIPLEDLSAMGISKDDVMKFLKSQLIGNGEKTRLHTDFLPDVEGDWQYSYHVLDSDKEIPLTVGKEIIRYKGNLVFVHDFIISPVD